MSVTILDGGMGRELMRMGAPFRQPEWSALALLEAPGLVEHAHGAFAAAGADVLTTSTYAIVPFHLGDGLFRARAADLAVEAGRRARSAADAAGRPVLVAGSLPPLFGSYRPDLFDADEAPGLLEPLIRGLMTSVDLWLCETASSTAEVEAALLALAGDRRPAWVSYTLADEPGAAPMLRSGEPIPLAVAKATQLGASAVLFNCSPPEVMAAALREALPVAEACGARLGVYANAFPLQGRGEHANEMLHELRGDLDPPAYLEFAREWVALGAHIVGGCCGIGPEHITLLSASSLG
jgi:S-methylmethionine-dependent homocysteine/selenocysteine methylase